MIKNTISVDKAIIQIEHVECSDPSWCREKCIFLESNSQENNTLTTISFNESLSIYVFWESHSSADSFEVLFAPETDVLFIGCGSISARVSTNESKLVGLESLCLFWSFRRHKDYVLETGELECFLYTLDGEKVSSTSVDPPYEMKMLTEGIKFESIVVGTTWLRYPNNG